MVVSRVIGLIKSINVMLVIGQPQPPHKASTGLSLHILRPLTPDVPWGQPYIIRSKPLGVGKLASSLPIGRNLHGVSWHDGRIAHLLAPCKPRHILFNIGGSDAQAKSGLEESIHCTLRVSPRTPGTGIPQRSSFVHTYSVPHLGMNVLPP